MYASSNGSLTPRKKERRVTIVCRHTNSEQHVAGVEGLVVAPDSSWLYTASRDSTVKRWEFASGKPSCSGRWEGHIDWVNDIVVLDQRLVSCSSDRSVRVWDTAGEAGACLHTFQQHSDYVTCLAAAAAQRRHVASGGLRGEVVLYDLETGQTLGVQPQPQSSSSDGSGAGGGGGDARCGSGGAAKGSIYALAMAANGSLLASGTTEGFVRVLDMRTGRKAMKLRGHLDNVRALAVNADGSLLLSGSSDNTIRLWDLGQQRCVQTLALHNDSVWTLAASPDFSAVYSGSRDGAVFRTHLGQRAAQLLLQDNKPVRRLALAHEASQLWLCNTSSSVSAYNLLRTWAEPARAAGAGAGRASGHTRAAVMGSSPALRLRRAAAADADAPAPELAAPALTVPGAPGLVAHRVLPSRRAVLTADSNGDVALWDVLRCQVVEEFGRVELQAKEAELWQPVSVPSWFSADTKLGCLAVHLELPSCFSAEVYAQDLGISGAPDDAKVNLGATLLRTAFRVWAARYARDWLSGQPLPAPDDLGDAVPSFSDDLPPAVISQHTNGVHWRRLATQFSGSERQGDDIPTWVGEVVLRGVFPAVKELKAAFVLLPAEGSNLPSLLQSRLNAPRILQVQKVATYCASKLAELSVPVAVHPVGLSREGQVPPTAAEQQVLELTCNGMAVPHMMSIASVKKFIWKRSDDVVFHFRILDPARPAPLPDLKPPPPS